ncbi:MAG: hypothetical protein JWN25_332 [Verrucomicrobiales bacterium]|nr:hypothetical protein [Verrucomicrobiales bacterium]
MIQDFTMKLAILIAAFSFISLVASEAETNRDDLQRGIYEQEVKHNTNAAIVAYEQVIHDFDAQKAMAKFALARMAELQSLNGNEGQAKILRERLALEFAAGNASMTLVSTHKQRESSLGISPRPTLLDRPTLDAQAYESRQQILEQLKREKGEKRRIFALETGYGDLRPLMESINQLEAKLIDMTPGDADAIKKEQGKLKNAEDQMDLHIDAMIKILELRQAAEKPVQVQFFGEVSRGPGNVSLAAGKTLTLFQGLNHVGLTQFANSKKIKLYRKNLETGKVETTIVNFEEIKHNPTLDIVLQDGDRVEIPQKLF